MGIDHMGNHPLLGSNRATTFLGTCDICPVDGHRKVLLICINHQNALFFLAYFVSSFQQKVSNRQVGKKLTERFTKSGRNFHVNILGANLGYSNNLYTMYSSNIFTNSDNAILPKTVENPDSSRNVSIFNFCKFALPPVVAHHHHSKLTLSLSAPSYYLGISKVILNNINLPHQRGKNYVVNYLAQKSGSTTHLGAKSCGHPW